MSDLFGRFPGWLFLIWGRPCVRRCVVRPADVCCGVAGRRDASGAFASCRSINSRPLFSSFSDHLPPPSSPSLPLCRALSKLFSGLLGPSPAAVQSPSGPPRVPLQTLSRPFSGPSRTLRNPPPTPQDTKKEVAPSVQPPLPEPIPRLDFASLVFSLLLAAWGIADDADIPGVIRVLRLRVPLFIAPVVLCALAAIWQRTMLSVIALCLVSLPCLLGILTTLWRISLLRNRRFLPFGRWLLQGVGVVSHRP